MGEEWSRYFWDRGLELAEPKLEFDVESPMTEPDGHPAQQFANEYRRVCIRLLESSWSLLPKSLLESEEAEVIGAILARQCQLTIKVVQNLDLWEWNVGPLFLRAMTDGYITLAWILQSPLERSREFINHGLGQEKLQIEHYRTQLNEIEDESDKEEMRQMIALRETWLNAQHFGFLQEVNVGSWSGVTTRKMAEEAGCVDLYRFAYTPFSFCAHNTWNHLGKFCCRHSHDPLHKFFRQPFFLDMGIEPSVFMNSAKYYQKSLRAVSRRYGFTLGSDLPYDWAAQRIEKLLDTFLHKQGQAAEPKA